MKPTEEAALTSPSSWIIHEALQRKQFRRAGRYTDLSLRRATPTEIKIQTHQYLYWEKWKRVTAAKWRRSIYTTTGAAVLNVCAVKRHAKCGIIIRIKVEVGLRSKSERGRAEPH